MNARLAAGSPGSAPESGAAGPAGAVAPDVGLRALSRLTLRARLLVAFGGMMVIYLGIAAATIQGLLDVARSIPLDAASAQEAAPRVAADLRDMAGRRIALVVVGALAWVAVAPSFAWWLGRPIRAIVTASRRLAAGDLSHRIGIRAGGELGEAARAFDDMAARLEASYAEVRESREQYRLLADSARDVIWTTDLDLRLTYVSPSVLLLTGSRPEAVLERPVWDCMTPTTRAEAERLRSRILRDVGERTAAEPLSYSFAGDLVRADGTTVPTEAVMTVVRTGPSPRIVGVTRDVSERRRLEAMKADFTALASHQLRTPLNGIRWLLEVAESQPELSVKTRSYLADAAASASRLVETVNNLLDATQLEAGTLHVTPGPVDLGPLTASVLRELDPVARDKGLAVRAQGLSEAGVVLADGGLLRQAVANLIANALKYTPPGGTIDVRVQAEPARVRWTVRDTGIGVPRAAQGHLFGKFFRADNAVTMSAEGTGLGLYLAKLVIGRFGGDIWCDSEEGCGATFGFTLPRAS